MQRFSVSCVVDFVLWLGYARVILMSDNETPIVALLREALKSLRTEGLEQSMEQFPVPYGPAGNGSAELGVQLVKGRPRTCKRSLEIRVQHQIPATFTYMTCLNYTTCFVYVHKCSHHCIYPHT